MTDKTVLQRVLDYEIEWRESAIRRLENELEQNTFRVEDGKSQIDVLKKEVEELRDAL